MIAEAQTLPSNRQKSGCNDVFFAVLFYISLFINMAIAGYGITQYKTELFNVKHDTQFTLQSTDLLLMSAICGTSILFSVLWIFLVSLCTKASIKVSLIIEFLSYLIFGGIAVAFSGALVAIPFLVLLLVRLVWLWLVWNQINFSQAILSTALIAFKQYWAPIWIHILTGFLSMIILLVDVLSMATANQFLYSKQSKQNGKDDGAPSIISFAFVELVFLLWHLYCLSRVAFATSSGVMTQWLRKEPLFACGKFIVMCTKCFGSICLGTLLQAFVDALQYIMRLKRERADGCGNFVMYACLECCLRVLGDILEYVNSYAFVYVAKNEEPYLKSAKNVYQMLLQTGFCMFIFGFNFFFCLLFA